MKIQLLNEHLSQKWEEIGLFYPLKANPLVVASVKRSDTCNHE